jgi:hypothetical protein
MTEKKDAAIAFEAKKVENVWEAAKTLTGITLGEAYARIDADLGAKAYSEIATGGKKLTDIKPPYVYEMMSELFGPLGIGWGYELLEHEYIGSRQYKAQSGKTITEHGASATVRCWYALEGGVVITIGSMTGGSKNSERNYAESGAITNAIGKCLSMFGVQRHIYKNEEATVYENPDEADEKAKLSQRFDEMMVRLDRPEKLEQKLEVSHALGDPKNRNQALMAFLAMDEDKRVVCELLSIGEELTDV